MQTEASFIIRNARVLTMDAANPRANAVAIAGNRILAVGSEAEIDAFSGPDTHVIDAKGGTVLPGFNEAHMHIFGGSAELTELSLAGVKGFDACLFLPSIAVLLFCWMTGLTHGTTEPLYVLFFVLPKTIARCQSAEQQKQS